MGQVKAFQVIFNESANFEEACESVSSLVSSLDSKMPEINLAFVQATQEQIDNVEALECVDIVEEDKGVQLPPANPNIPQ